MPAIWTFGRGSKKAIARIRWKRSEVLLIFALILTLAVFSACLVVWHELHHFD